MMNLIISILLWCVAVKLGLTQTCNRLLTPGCVCFENITYECSVTGGNYTVTVWRVVNGLLSNSCEISLNHNQFENNGAVQIQCDSSTMLRLQAIRRESNCYISQLAIIPGPTGPFSFLNGGSIQCFVRHGMLIGTTALIISSRNNLPPPTDLRLADTKSEELIFNWTAPLQHCPSLEYAIYSSGACICPSTSGSNNTLSCIGTQCVIRVYSVVCTYYGRQGIESRTSSNVLSVNITAPSIICDPWYNIEDQLMRFETTFNTMEPFITSDEIENAIISYTITYSDSNLDTTCWSRDMQPSLFCEGGVCRDTFDITSSHCPPSADINISVSAISTYGKARLNQHPLKRDGVNNYTNVLFDHITETITCVFLSEPLDSMKECYVNVSYGANCNVLLGVYEVSGKGDALETPRLGFIEDIDQYCYKVIARNQNLNFNVIVEGIIDLQRSNTSGNNVTQIGVDVIVAAVASVAVLIMVGVLVSICVLFVRFQKSQSKGTQQPEEFEANPPTQESDVKTTIGSLKIHKDRQIGSGMFGYVFQGEIQSRPCAVKVLVEIGRELALNVPITSRGGRIQEARLESFEKECKYLLNLKHPNIVELIDVRHYPQSNAPCLIMELLDCSLRSYLNSTSHCLLLRTQISMSCDIAKALAYLHENKVIHRDLCSDNILIRKGDIPVAKIADFGMSRIFDMETMTHSISVLGHRNGYLPPEGPSNNYDLSLDIYMFGVIMVLIVHAIPDIRSPEERYKLINEVSETHPMKQVVNSCVMAEKADRPKAEEVSNNLQKLLQNI